MNDTEIPTLPDEYIDPDEELTPPPPSTGNQPGKEDGEIDVSLLPALPPPNSKAWDRSCTGRWKAMGCGCSALILVFVGITAYYSLRDTVWSNYEDTKHRLQSEMLISVPELERERLVRNLDAFDLMLNDQSDPYSLMGALVKRGRTALRDLTVNPEEAEELNKFLEAALASPNDIPK